MCMFEFVVVGLDTAERGGSKSWIILGESGTGGPSHHVHMVDDKPQAGLESIPAVTGGGGHPGLATSPSQDASIRHFILVFRQSAGTNKDMQNSPKPQRTEPITILFCYEAALLTSTPH